MTNATQTVLETLAKRGYRITAARKKIITALAQARTPVTILELTQLVETDEASVYRTMKTLTEEDLVEAIPVKGEKVRFALTHGHHHHVVCTDCGKIEHIACEGSVPTPKPIAHFPVITEHEVTYYGLCISCA